MEAVKRNEDRVTTPRGFLHPIQALFIEANEITHIDKALYLVHTATRFRYYTTLLTPVPPSSLNLNCRITNIIILLAILVIRYHSWLT